MFNEEKELTSAIKDAEKLHGHLGPFLVIGVRMGNIAKRILNTNLENGTLKVDAKIPLLTPFSCILDGIQTTTNCTIGNQKLKSENSEKEIAVRFELNSDSALKVSVNPEIVNKLLKKLSKGAPNEELVLEIIHMPEDQLFTIEKQ